MNRKLNSWPTKILITPYTVEDWDKKEKLLVESGFVVLPADLSSVGIIDKIVSRQIDTTAQRKEGMEAAYRSRFVNFQDFETLKAYLKEAPLVQWVCSLAVYPSVDWDFTIAMGKAIEHGLQLAGPGAQLVNYTNLLKIARISWMQDGVINESLRSKMLDYLDKEDEALARETLRRELQLIEGTINDNSLVRQQFLIHQKLNKFLLDAYYHKKVAGEDEAFVKKILERNELDEGQGIYLEESRNTMLWDPTHKKINVGLRKYFRITFRRRQLYTAGYALLIGAAMFLLGFYGLKNNSGYLNWQSLKPSVQDYIISINGNNLEKEMDFNLYYEPTHSKWRSQKIRLANATDTFRYNIPLIDTTGYGRLIISTIDGNIIAQDSFKLNSTIYNINIHEVAKTPLSIYFKNPSTGALANIISDNLPSYFSVSTQQANLPDTSGTSIIYFSAQYEEAALSAASVVSTLLNKNLIRPQKADSSAFPNARGSVVIFINETSSCVTLAPGSLPKPLNEIWHGGTSNRLINIDIPKKIIYYSTGDKRTYGTYVIDEVCLTKGTYKIITRADNQYAVFLFRNVRASSFEMSVCQNRYDTKAQAQAIDESYCDRFNSMMYYYESDTAKIFFPVNSNTIQRIQQTKIDVLNDHIARLRNAPLIVEVSGTKYYNSKFGLPAAATIPIQFSKIITLKDPTPFDRNYVIYSLKTSKKPDSSKRSVVDPCEKIFYSVQEALSVNAGAICKLNLSNQRLTAIPKEVYLFSNLQQLDLRTNQIPESDIQQLQKALPKCKILYDPPPQPKKDTSAYFLYTVEFNKDYPASSADNFIRRLGQLLKSYPDYRIMLVAEYPDEKSVENANRRLDNLKKSFLQYVASASQIQTYTRKATAQTEQQQQQKNVSSSRNAGRVTIYGIGFKEVPPPAGKDPDSY